MSMSANSHKMEMRMLKSALFGVLLLATPLLAATDIGDLHFTDDFDSLLANAGKSSKYLVIDFYSDG